MGAVVEVLSIVASLLTIVTCVVTLRQSQKKDRAG
jgi:hypothetical protein